MKSGWEIKGLNRKTIEKFSQRTVQIEKAAQEKQIIDPSEKALLGKKTREAKDTGKSLTELRAEWDSRLSRKEQFDFAKLRGTAVRSQGESEKDLAETAIQYALATSNQEREVIAGNVEFRNTEDYGMTGECDGIDLANRRRMVLGLNPLAIDYQLVLAGRDHSNDMATLGFFAHESPVPGKETPWKRAENFDTTASGENIAAGYGNERQATMGWWYSPGHLKNMMGQGHNRIGLGTTGTHYTQLFGR